MKRMQLDESTYQDMMRHVDNERASARRGLGFVFDIVRGTVRHWYLDKHGVQRWADNDKAVGHD